MQTLSEIYIKAYNKFVVGGGDASTPLLDIIEDAGDYAYHASYMDDGQRYEEEAINKLKELIETPNAITTAERLWIENELEN